MKTVIDLFSGAGGLHVGFERAGFKILLATDIDENVEKCHLLNYPHIPFIRCDVADLKDEELRPYLKAIAVDVVTGGPPCKGFSTIGKRISSDPKKRTSRDFRNYLFLEYIRVLKIIHPKVFVMENVSGMLTLDRRHFFRLVSEQFDKLSEYKWHYDVLDCVDFGVPQYRKRVFICGSRIGPPPRFPAPTHHKGGPLKWVNHDGSTKITRKYVTVGDSIMDLVGKENQIPNHVPMRHGPKNIQRYKLIPEGKMMPEDKLPPEIWRKNFGTTFRRLSRFEPSVTIVPGHSAFPIHPTLDRSLTVREAARLMTFDDNIIFTGTRTPQGLLVGNAVPPKIAEALGDTINKYLKRLEPHN